LTKAIADSMNKAALTKLRLFLLHFQLFVCGVVWTWQFAVECLMMLLSVYQATGYASQHYSKPVEIGRLAAERAFSVIMGNDGGRGTDSLDGVASRQIVGVSASAT